MGLRKQEYVIQIKLNILFLFNDSMCILDARNKIKPVADP